MTPFIGGKTNKSPQAPTHPEEDARSLGPAAAEQRSDDGEEGPVQHGRRDGELRAQRQVLQRQAPGHLGDQLRARQEGDERRRARGGQGRVGGLQAAPQLGAGEGQPPRTQLAVVPQGEGSRPRLQPQLPAPRLLALHVAGVDEGGFEEVQGKILLEAAAEGLDLRVVIPAGLLGPAGTRAHG